MFFVISKIIGFILKPIGILFIGLIYSVSLKNRTKIKRNFLILIVLTYVLTIPAVCSIICDFWEPSPLEIEKLKTYDYGIVLTGGIINEAKSTGSNIFLGSDGDRIYQTARLYNANKIKKILITGGDFSNQNIKTKIYENDKAYEFLVDLGIPKNDILQEKKSRNTYENALFTSKLLKTTNNIIITSAYHVRRSKACFSKQNLNYDAFPCTYLNTGSHWTFMDFMPSINTLHKNELILNEIYGFIGYKLKGYI